MPEYLSPGVYVEEVPSGVKPIEGVGTSTGAFIGVAGRGPTYDPDRRPELITNWTQFVDTFGGFFPNSYLGHAVYQFFNEGGTRCYVVRAKKQAGSALKRAEKTVGDLLILAASEGQWGNNIRVVVDDESVLPGVTPRAGYFKLTIQTKSPDGQYKVVEMHDNLTMKDTEDDHVVKRIPSRSSRWIDVQDKGDTVPGKGTYDLAGGADEAGIGSDDYAECLKAFDLVDDINILAIPDAAGDEKVAKKALSYCENRKDCFFVADPPKGCTLAKIIEYRGKLGVSSYGALYYPWIKVSNPLTGGDLLAPASGAVVGTYSHTDIVRGVHKAPAGIEEGSLNSALDVERHVSAGEQDTLNPIGVNVIRSFALVGPVIWGARTLAGKGSEWTYVNVRRLLLFIEESIDEGTQWVVFEPNTPLLWGRVKRNITAFLTRVWRDGALFGTTASEAFFVKVDAENNPEEAREVGQLIIEVGVAPVRPAEFVIIRISQKTQGKGA